jgi:hypothetical protein
MPAETVEGELIMRAWDRTTCLSESSARVASLAELFEVCLAAGEPQLIDRIVIRGLDTHDQPRVLTFVFQSITVSPQAEA